MAHHYYSSVWMDPTFWYQIWTKPVLLGANSPAKQYIITQCCPDASSFTSDHCLSIGHSQSVCSNCQGSTSFTKNGGKRFRKEVQMESQLYSSWSLGDMTCHQQETHNWWCESVVPAISYSLHWNRKIYSFNRKGPICVFYDSKTVLRSQMKALLC